MLVRNVEVLAKAFFTCDEPDKIVGDHIGITVKKPDPLQPINLCQLAKQQRDAVRQSDVFSVCHGVLRDNDKFAHSLLCEPARLGNKVVQLTATETAAKARDRAECAYVIAALRDF